MNRLRKLICVFFGHRYLSIQTEGDSSIYGWFHCMRCGHDEAFQYDF